MKIKKVNRFTINNFLLSSILLLTLQLGHAQQVEVEGELKVTQLTANDTQDNLVVHNSDGTLGSRSVSSLPQPPPPIDTSRNLASDFELAKHLCECGSNIPPFLAESLLASGYTQADLLGAGVPFANLPFTCGDTIIDDRDGKMYATVLIGSQCWMAENLNVGNRIDGTIDMANNLILEKYCFDDENANCAIYGGLYQWDEMMQYQTIESHQGLCPTNWHVPSDNEWKTLEIELGMSQAQADLTGDRGTDQGSQLAGNETLWIDGNLDQNAAFGSSGFGALPGGLRYTAGSFFNQAIIGGFWSSSESGGDAWYRYLSYVNSEVGRNFYQKWSGFSVRCVQD